MNIVRKLASRFAEPSSWAGLVPLVALVGYNLDPGLAQSITLAGAGVCGVVAFVLPESGK